MKHSLNQNSGARCVLQPLVQYGFLMLVAGLVLGPLGLRAATNRLTTLAVSAGEFHGLATRSDGTIWGWGKSDAGQLGTGTTNASLFPVRVDTVSNAQAVVAARFFSLALLADGRVVSWGANTNGQLGNGTTSSSLSPVWVTGLSNAVSIAASESHALAVTADGMVRAWGMNGNGQLGNNSTTGSSSPVAVSNLTNAIAVGAGYYQSVALRSDGTVWTWGGNGAGQLGNNSYLASKVPVQAVNLSNIVAVAVGRDHSLALKSDGTVWSWGFNGNGELGLGHFNNVNIPTQITALSGVRSIAAGFGSSLALLNNGKTWLWGYQNDAQPTPSQLADSGVPAFTALARGNDFSLGVTADGAVWVWGRNDSGLFANGTYSRFATDYFMPQFAFASAPMGRFEKFNRGDLRAMNSCSTIVPLDLEKGVALNQTGSEMVAGSTDAPWSLRIARETRLHVGSTNIAPFPVENPLAAFGSQAGGAPLYVSQPYSFGVYAGGFDESMASATNAIRISVYDRSQFGGTGTNLTPLTNYDIALPRRTVAADSNAWYAFVADGSSKTVESTGLRTKVEFVDGPPASKPWGLSWLTGAGGQPAVITNFILAGYKLTHTATSTNYYYKVELLGRLQVATNNLAYFATNSAGTWTPLPLYTLDFETLPPWRSILVDRPHFEAIPLPPNYAGKTIAEMNGLSMPVTNTVDLSSDAAYTNLDTSPELRTNAILDRFVQDMGKDPLALASYVINEIDLTDAYASAESSDVVKAMINAGGVNRGALATFLEGQGSPIEQCALLVYLLRRANIPAAYVFPQNGNLRMLDTRISQLWQVQVQGVINSQGIPYVTNSLIGVNYPWVVANISNTTVHIFPWLKDTEIVEGVDLYDYMPTNYNTALKWVREYLLGNANILGLEPESNLPLRLWPKFIEQVLLTNQPAARLSLDDVGVRAFNRRNQFPTWAHLPQPNFITNASQVTVAANLSQTNSFAFLTNIFDTIRVEVYSNTVGAANLLLTSGDWFTCEWHNRKLLLFTNSPTNLVLWLAASRTNETGAGTFAGPGSPTKQTKTVTVITNAQLKVRTVHQRRVARLAQPANAIPEGEYKTVTNDTSCLRNDTTAICTDFGRVTLPMLRVHADDYWMQQRRRATNTSYVPPTEDLQGTAAYMLGMGYFEKLARFDDLNQRVHKVRGMVNFKSGLGIIGAVSASTNAQPKVDMHTTTDAMIGNGTLHPDSSETFLYAAENYVQMNIANGSAQEHDIIMRMFDDKDAISTVRLLQLAQARATNGNTPVLEMFKNTYLARGNQTNAYYGTNLLKNQDPGIWAAVSNAFAQWDGDYARVFITPGLITNQSKSYAGMGALVLNKQSQGALISGNNAPIYGGWGSIMPTFNASATSYEFPYNLYAQGDAGFAFANNNLSVPDTQSYFSAYDALFLTTGSGVSGINYSPAQLSEGSQVSGFYGLSGSTGLGIQASTDGGYLGQAVATFRDGLQVVYDPVSVISGEFYVDTVDLNLPGPLPLQLRRNYLSRNLAENEFGCGWKFNFMPYLAVSTTNANTNSVIQAADLDGAVIVYRWKTNNVWTVMPSDNPTLNNNSTAGKGATANAFNSTLERYTTNGVTYLLKTPDGTRRTYAVSTSFGLSSGTNSLNRVRPYLTRWEDHAGNYHLFSYGNEPLANDFGQLNRIESANGNFLVLKYDFFARIVEAFTGDGRRAKYEYDDYGDLVTVRLPDDSTWNYEYQHSTFVTTNNGSLLRTNIDSDHLLVREKKPNGRLLQNVYDSYRRVTVQAATVGTNLALVTNAWFFYTNNCVSVTNQFLCGTTRVEDVFRNATLYSYTNNLITRIGDPLGGTISQDWFEAGETNAAGYYFRSLQASVDKRGLTCEFLYDANGNVTTNIIRGDLTGSGNTSESATNRYTYTTSNLPDTITDPAGNAKQFTYDGGDAFRAIRVIDLSSGTPVATNDFAYTNVVETLANPARTNRAYGLCWREVRAGGAIMERMFDGRGWPVQSARYTPTDDSPDDADPAVTTFHAYTARGELYEQRDAAGRITRFDYDAMGRMKWREVYDENGQALSREHFYYNRNGELEWYDGPRYDPEDFVWYAYDGAGRKIQEIHWRTQAKADGSGVEAATGDGLYATTFYEYDGFNNLTRVVDPRGNYRRLRYDALGQAVAEEFYDSTGSLLATNGFAYSAGGDVTNAFNALGARTDKLYTSTGKLKAQQNPSGSTNAWYFYLDGRAKEEVLPNGSHWTNIYTDAARTLTRCFMSGSTVLASNVTQRDARGNAIYTQDAAGFVWTNRFDGLDRLKVVAGPTATNRMLNMDVTYTTNISQQTTTYTYDASGKVRTVANALGEKTVTTSDALGRPVLVEILKANNDRVRVSSTAYPANHHSVTITSGSGANAIATTRYTDTFGRPILDIAYPAANAREYTLSSYDSSENLVWNGHHSITNGAVTLWSVSAFSYDGLNRVKTEAVRDNATTTNTYNAIGNLTQRAMPGGVTWSASYTNDGRMLGEQDSGGTNTARSTAYSYYTPPHAWAGQLQTATDGRGVTRTQSYDPWLRLSSVAIGGAEANQQMTVAWAYDPRGLLTNLSQYFANANTGPATAVRRTYDAYGHLQAETVSVEGAFTNGTSQKWDDAGRRTQLSVGQWQPAFAYQADGLMTAAGEATFGYADNGLLTGRTNTQRTMTVVSRDGVGRRLQTATSPGLSEALTWRGDGLLTAYIQYRTDFTNVQQYAYAPWTQRLVQESLSVAGGQPVVYTYAYDQDQPGQLGVLTAASQSSSQLPGQWAVSGSGGLDGLKRITVETNTIVHRGAYGQVNGPAAVRAYLNGRVVGVRNDGTKAGQWTADLELAVGTNTLTVFALHPSGQYTNSATNSFTLTNGAADRLETAYDGNGSLTQRVWRNATNATVRTQTLTWDAFNRLMRVAERDAQNHGYDWAATFDPLGRRALTQITLVSNNVATATNTLKHYYDPLVEFLEVGVSVNGVTMWKLYGPDGDGAYGSQQGLGGLELLKTDGTSQQTAVLQDHFGNVLAGVVGGIPQWVSARVSAYGPVEGTQLAALSVTPLTVEHLAWRGKWRDVTGDFYWGARPYDPKRRAFIAFDTLGHTATPGGYTAFGGMPTVTWDPDARLGRGAGNSALDMGMGLTHLMDNTLGAVAFQVTAPFSYDWAAQQFGNQARNFNNTISGLGNLAMDAGGFVSYAAISPFAPDFAYNTLGSSMDRLGQVGTTLTGGENNSGAYRVGYTAFNVAALFGGDLWQMGRGDGLGVAADAAGGMNPNILSGHGALVVGDSSPVTFVPKGTSLTVWSEHGNTISDALGNAIETGASPTLQQFPGAAGARTYLPGSAVPNYTLYPPTWGNPINIMGNPTTVAAPTSLSTLLQPGMGNVNWAACLEVVPK